MPLISPELSKLYTERYGIPIEIQENNDRKGRVDPRIDRLVFEVPYTLYLHSPINPKNPDDVQREKQLASFERYVQSMVDKWGDTYRKNPVVKINSESSFRSELDRWANEMDIPTPSLSLSDTLGIWGTFKPSSSGSGHMSLHEFLQFVPLDIAQVAIVHEMVHAKLWYDILQKYSNVSHAASAYDEDPHGSLFQKTFRSYLPNYKSLEKALDAAYIEVYNTVSPKMNDH